MSPADWASLPALIAHHQIGLLAATLLVDVPGVPPELAASFATQAPARRAGQVRSLADLQRLSALLGDRPWALLKGAVLADHVWSRRLREYGDLDVLVHPSDVPLLLEELEVSGVVLNTRNWQFVHDGDWGEMSLTLWRGASLDLHWSVLGKPGDVRGVCFDTAGVLARRRPVVVGGGSTRIEVDAPDPADLLLHVAVHALLDGLERLRNVADVVQLLTHDPVDPAVLIDRARETGTALMLAVVLQRTLPFHEDRDAVRALIRDLAPRSPWLALMRLNERVNPVRRSDRDVSLGFVAASTRDRSWSSLRTAGVLGVHAVGLRVGRNVHDQQPIWAVEVDDGYRARVLDRLKQH